MMPCGICWGLLVSSPLFAFSLGGGKKAECLVYLTAKYASIYLTAIYFVRNRVRACVACTVILGDARRGGGVGKAE